MPSAHLGVLAALATAVCWSGSAVFFSAAGRRIGSVPVNLWRLVMAVVMLAVLSWALRGRPFPDDAPASVWGWLAASGVVGLVLGDICLFRAYVLLGPRLTLLLTSLSPFFTALGGWLVLDEVLTVRQLLGVGLTGLGIALALGERPGAQADERSHRSLAGVLLGIGGAVGQAGGLILSKRGMNGYHPVASTEIRALTALACFLLLFTVTRQWPRALAAARDGRGMGLTALGSLCGPCLGVAFSLVALEYSPAGVAASLMALSPLIVLPFSIYRGERVGWAGALGAVLAVGGVWLLVF